MRDTKIKICGVNDIDIAKYIYNINLDYLGLVFCKNSVRNIEIDIAKDICSLEKKETKNVALFMDSEKNFIKNIIKEVNVDIIQFHGMEKDSFCSQFDKPFIKAVSYQNKELLLNLDQHYPNAYAFIVDSHQEGEMGGTGTTFQEKNLSFSSKKPILVAGGINSTNVINVVKTYNPYGIDVSSGVESSKGIKSIKLIKELVEIIKNE